MSAYETTAGIQEPLVMNAPCTDKAPFVIMFVIALSAAILQAHTAKPLEPLLIAGMMGRVQMHNNIETLMCVRI